MKINLIAALLGAAGLVYFAGCEPSAPPAPESERRFSEELKIKAERGDVQAQHNVGYCYFYGLAVRKNLVTAVVWFRKAAKKNYAPAQYALGLCYLNGQGVEQSDTTAIKWFLKAAEQGCAPAQQDLGYCHFNGRGVSKDKVEAVKWWRKAAVQSCDPARINLGLAYAAGDGVAKDPVEAFAWFSLAGSTVEMAAVNRDGLQKTVTSEEITAAKKRIEDLRRLINRPRSRNDN